jgi:hypothetical protein
VPGDGGELRAGLPNVFLDFIEDAPEDETAP